MAAMLGGTSSANLGNVRSLGSSVIVKAMGWIAFPTQASVVTPVLLSWQNGQLPNTAGWRPAPGASGGSPLNAPGVTSAGSTVGANGVPGIQSVSLVSAGVLNFNLAMQFLTLESVNLTFATTSNTNAAPACDAFALSLYNTNVTGQIGNFSPGIGTAPPVALNASCPAKQVQVLLYAPGGTMLTTPATTDVILYELTFRQNAQT